MVEYFKSDNGKMYSSRDEAVKADKAYAETLKDKDIKKKEREDAAKHVSDLYEKARNAEKDANKALKDFVHKYGSYHKTFYSTDVDDLDPFDVFLKQIFDFM